MLHEFIGVHREEIITRCRAKVATRSIPPPTDPDGHGVPLFLDQLMETQRDGRLSNPEIGRRAMQHGHDLLTRGFTVSQVVHEYGDVCQAITDLAVDRNVSIGTDDFRFLNRCLDDAIAGAVTEYGRARNQSTLDGESARGSERMGFLAHELRDFLNTAIIALEVLKTGSVGVGGSTGAILQRSLLGARDLIGRSLAEIRLTEGVQYRERFRLVDFIGELAPTAGLAAQARDLTFTLLPIDDTMVVEADRQVLRAVMMNLLQNAFKFTRPGTTVTLGVVPRDERLQIEVTDECGGLPAGDSAELFRPFTQVGGDRSGLGLGLAFCRWGAEANRGQISARSIPGHGCVFTVDLPRVTTAPVTVGA